MSLKNVKYLITKISTRDLENVTNQMVVVPFYNIDQYRLPFGFLFELFYFCYFGAFESWLCGMGSTQC